jgi:hypothetical protein
VAHFSVEKPAQFRVETNSGLPVADRPNDQAIGWYRNRSSSVGSDVVRIAASLLVLAPPSATFGNATGGKNAIAPRLLSRLPDSAQPVTGLIQYE